MVEEKAKYLTEKSLQGGSIHSVDVGLIGHISFLST